MNDSRQCRATNRQGTRCGRAAIIGGTVCNLHGGKTPVAIVNAHTRIQEMVDAALAALRYIVEDDSIPPAVRLNAARDIMDRAGYKPPQVVEVLTMDLVEREIARLEAEMNDA